jgi:hypothetical protein
MNRIAAIKHKVDAWLAAQAKWLDPLRSSSEAERFFRQKCFNELCFYLAWNRELGLHSTPALQRMSAHVDTCLDGDYLDWACRSPIRSLAFSQSLGYALRLRGKDAPDMARVVEALTGRFSWNTELLPCRQLDLLVACHVGQVKAPLDAATVLANSSVMVPPCPIFSDREAFYSFTHSVIYGALVSKWQLPVLSETRDATIAGLQRALADADADLATELTLSAAVLGVPLEGVCANHINELISKLTREDVLRPVAIRSAPLRAFQLACPDDDWAVSFHEMVVVGMLFSWLETFGVPVAPSCPETLAGAITYGTVYQLLHRYQIATALALLENSAPRYDAHQRDLERITAFLLFIRRPDGHFGCFSEERRLFEQNYPGHDFDRELRTPLSLACVRYLAKHGA